MLGYCTCAQAMQTGEFDALHAESQLLVIYICNACPHRKPFWQVMLHVDLITAALLPSTMTVLYNAATLMQFQQSQQ